MAAAMAPVLAVVLNAPAAGPSAGGAAVVVPHRVRGLPLRGQHGGAVLPADAVGWVLLHVNTQGLGQAAGFFTGWLFWIGYALLAPGLFCAFGAFVHDYVLLTFHKDVSWVSSASPRWPWCSGCPLAASGRR